ncbi:DUF6445 family protein [Phenylobacterium sp.]|uniref:DUF6445 family protein n=1 Tax=Phenylobacterium sp. TaxID=1871053 RepID=UPI003561B241
MTLDFRPHDAIVARTDLVGAEGSPVMVFDNFAAEPEALVDYAASVAPFPPAAQSFYPGVRAAVPMPFVRGAHGYLDGALRAVFGLGDQAVVSGGWEFSLVTQGPETLSLRQRMPHIDSTHPGNLALLLYLAREGQGGTGFYRHRSTGYETITEARFDRYEASLKAEVAALGEPRGYVCGDTPIFERIADYEPVFNRMIAYRSRNLHAASLRPGFAGDPDPRTGRLTLNLFLHYRAKSS